VKRSNAGAFSGGGDEDKLIPAFRAGMLRHGFSQDYLLKKKIV
jgi:hypothetical protein